MPITARRGVEWIAGVAGYSLMGAGGSVRRNGLR
jgi:hypothetical protein